MNFLRAYGVSAGNFKPNVPAYVGQGLAASGFVPGRIQISQPSGLYYTANMKVSKLNNQVEFLKKNDDYDYKWVVSSSSKCIGGGVTVDDTFYIGRVVIGDYSYIGRVEIGQRGLKYENSNEKEVLTNEYEVLTCIEKKCSNKDGQKDKDLLDTCEKRITSLNADIQEGLSKYSGCERLLNETQDKNILLKRMVDILDDQIKNCTSVPTICPDIEKENVMLKKEIDEISREATITARKIKIQASRIKDLESLVDSNKGVQGCLNALKSVDSLTENEHTSLIIVISKKIPETTTRRMP